jgi:uncharacterized protein YaaN involved in tellurite resistance
MTSSTALVTASSEIAAAAGTLPVAGEQAEIARLAATIDIRSPLTVAAFGQDIAEKTAGYADDLLNKAHSGDLDEAGAKLNEVVAVAQSFDLTSFDNKWARTPIVGAVVRQFSMSKERALSRFQTVSTQIDKLTHNLDLAADRLARRAQELEVMHAGVCEEHRHLELHMRAAQLRLEQMDAEIASLRGGGGAEALATAGAAEASRNALERRVADFAALRHSAFQTLPMIRVMQANNLALVEKFQTIQRLTLPAWKRTFTMAVALNEQRDAVRLATSIDDATNHFMRKNAELLHDNSVATAQANQRLAIDIDTLRDIHNQVLKTLDDVRGIHAAGAKSRAATVVELERLRREMAASFGVGAVHEDPPALGAPA